MYNEHPELAIYSGESFRKGIHLRYESWVTVLLPLERSHRSFASFKPARLLYHSFPFFVIPSLWFLPLDSALFIRVGIHPVPLHTTRDHLHQFKGAHRRCVWYNYGRFHFKLHSCSFQVNSPRTSWKLGMFIRLKRSVILCNSTRFLEIIFLAAVR